MKNFILLLAFSLVVSGCTMRKSPEAFADAHKKNAVSFMLNEKLPVVYERTLKFAKRCLHGTWIGVSKTSIEPEVLADKTHVIRIKLDGNDGMGSTVDSYAAIAELTSQGDQTWIKIYAPSRNKYLKRAFTRWAKNESDSCPEVSMY